MLPQFVVRSEEIICAVDPQDVRVESSAYASILQVIDLNMSLTNMSESSERGLYQTSKSTSKFFHKDPRG